jgi:hypothetical protein
MTAEHDRETLIAEAQWAIYELVRGIEQGAFCAPGELIARSRRVAMTAPALLDELSATVAARDEALAKVAEVETLLDCGQLRMPGCCSSCDGTGINGDETTGGQCWDCRSTGHAHGPVGVDDLGAFLGAIRRVAAGSSGVPS